MKYQVYRVASLEPGVSEVEGALDEALLALGPAEDLVARRVGDDHAGGGPLAPAEGAGVARHVEDGDVDADARDVLREGAEEEEEGRKGPQGRQPHDELLQHSGGADFLSRSHD